MDFVQIGTFILNVLEQQGLAGLVLILLIVIMVKFGKPFSLYLQKTINAAKNAKDGQRARQEVDLKMQSLLNSARIALQADKAAIFEFHNGGHNATGLPFRHLSLSILLNEIGCDEDVMQFNGIPTSSISGFIKNLQKQPFYYFGDIKELKNLFPALYYKLRQDGVIEAVFAPINGIDDENIGIIMFAINNHHSEDMDKQNIESILIPRLQQLSTLLDLKNH